MGVNLSAMQREAVEHFTGPCLCIAGPGSGKTLVLTERISYLIREHGISPQNILVVTFTKDAAMSMKQRFSKNISVSPSPAFGTFHSVFFNILRKEGRIDAKDIISGSRSAALLSYVINQYSIKSTAENFYPRLLSTISFYKNTGMLDENLFPPDVSADDVRRIINGYQHALREACFYDFDDLLVETGNFFKKHPDRLSYWRQRFSFIMVDEMQDCNLVQMNVLKQLAAPLNNIFVVGDDDQSIYGFRGSDPSFMLGFKYEFPGTHVVVLNCNYRCDKAIVESSARLISSNKKRFDKNLVAASEDEGIVEIITAENEAAEASLVTKKIDSLLGSGTDPKEIAVLYRNRRVVSSLLNAISKSLSTGIDMNSYFYKSEVFCDILSILRCTGDSIKREDFLRALSHPDRGIGRMGLSSDTIDKSIWLSYMRQTVLKKAAEEFIEDIDFIARLSPFSAISYISKSFGYEKYIKEICNRNGTDASTSLSYVERLKVLSKGFRRIDDFCEEMSLQRENALSQINDRKHDSDGIGFYTFHGSKGLEFDHVFIIGACDGITPSDKADSIDRIEEERRMFYVAMTRAKKHLVISVCARYGNRTYYPSPFLKEAFG